MSLGSAGGRLYRWIASGQLDRELDDGAVQYGPRARRVSKLDQYKGVIDARLAEYPELSAVRLFEEVGSAGYAGGYDQVKRYVREVRPRVPEEPVQRFETPPGHQAQMDLAEFRLPWGKRHALIALARADGSYPKLVQRLARTWLLILHDWGLASLSGQGRHDLLEVLDDRYARRGTILASQLPVEHWHDVVGDPTFGDAILDRLLNNAHRITLKGGSMRRLYDSTREAPSPTDHT